MALIHHVATGDGPPPVVFVHGFACGHTDWDAQVAHLSPRHRTVAVDLRGHGASPGTADECSIERYGADEAEVMRALVLPPAVLVGHSMGCRVVVEAVLQAPEHAVGVVLVDGSQFAPAMEATFREAFATPEGYANLVQRWFRDMFTAKSGGRSARRSCLICSATMSAASPARSPLCTCRPWPSSPRTATRGASGGQ